MLNTMLPVVLAILVAGVLVTLASGDGWLSFVPFGLAIGMALAFFLSLEG